MFDVRKLKAIMIVKGLNPTAIQLSEIIERHYTTCAERLVEGNFTLAETITIAKALDMNKDEYFEVFIGKDLK